MKKSYQKNKPVKNIVKYVAKKGFKLVDCITKFSLGDSVKLNGTFADAFNRAVDRNVDFAPVVATGGAYCPKVSGHAWNWFPKKKKA